jgi:hypothetical protein
MKWCNMKKVDKIRINNGLPLEEKKKSKKNNNHKQRNTKSPPSNSKPAANPGRPIGTTNKAKLEQTKNFAQMKNDIALSWVEIKILPKDDTKKISLKQLVTNKQQEYQLDADRYSVSTTCIYSRISRDCLEVKGTGLTSPVIDVEPLVVMFINLSTDCNNTLTKREIIEFTNLYIKGTQAEQDIIAWNLVHQVDLQNPYISKGIKPICRKTKFLPATRKGVPQKG